MSVQELFDRLDSLDTLDLPDWMQGIVEALDAAGALGRVGTTGGISVTELAGVAQAAFVAGQEAVAGGPPLDIFATVALLLVLGAREVAVAAGPRGRPVALRLTFVAVPLLLAFALVVITRLPLLLALGR